MSLDKLRPSPIILFVYNRLWHTQQTIAALSKNALSAKSKLIIFSDGWKNDKDKMQVETVRKFIRQVDAFQEVVIHESNVNKGLAQSVISGVSTVLEQHDRAIILEDDMITSPSFLIYMNSALDMYKDEDDVISIHAYVYPVRAQLPETFFLRGADCWGWATWKRGWNLFEADGHKLLKELEGKNLGYEFDFNGSYPFKRMLEKQISGANNSWAIRWYATAFLKGKLTLYPGRSLVQNIGNDTSGTHSWDSERFNHHVLANSIDLLKIKIEENKAAKGIISAYLKDTNPSVFKKILYKLKFLKGK